VIPDDPQEEKHYTETDEGIKIVRQRTTVEKEFYKRKAAAQSFITQLPKEPLPHVDAYIPPCLSGAIFCGHLVTDLDSIAGSIGAAELYGGYCARASDINTETAFALKRWGIDPPRPVEDMLLELPESGVCLVDHQQTSQLSKAIEMDRIVGVIDHHALQNSTIVTDMPIYIDIRPWGSMSTIIAHTFMTLNKRPKKTTAGMLLCAILSDTLNLQGPTTTEWDKLMVAVLVELADVDDVQFLATQQFKAKSSELADLSSYRLVNGDQKVFTFKTNVFDGSVGFAVIETTDDEVILRRKAELLIALYEDKMEKGLTLLFLAVVNIVELRTQLLVCGENERSLAEHAFTNGKFLEHCIMDLGGLVSRKKDFIPAVTGAIKRGWSEPHKPTKVSFEGDIPHVDSGVFVETPGE
jgi:inorganic pyrophosphatase/exopolyphosphatase